jgi:hypothetical protein
MGNNIKAIQRRSYRIPMMKEGIASPNDTPLPKAKKVASLKMVNINRKMSNRFITHRMVFGILYFISNG